MELTKQASTIIKTILDDSDSLKVADVLSQNQKLSIFEVKRLTKIETETLRQRLMLLMKKNLVSYEKAADGNIFFRLNHKTVEDVFYLPLYLGIVKRKFGKVEEIIVHNMLLNISIYF